MTSLELARGIAATVREAPADVDPGPIVLAFLERNGCWISRVIESQDGVSIDVALPKKSRRLKVVAVQVCLPFE